MALLVHLLAVQGPICWSWGTSKSLRVDQRRMTSSKTEPWESPGTCSSVVIDSSIIPVLHIAQYVGSFDVGACAERESEVARAIPE